MPELPEVETMRMQLDKFLTGSTITDVTVSDKRILTGEVKDITGGKVTGVRRFAKVTSIDLSNGFSILTHVKLTGQFIYRGPKLKSPKKLSIKVVGGVPGPHTHITFHFSDGGILYYNDIRRFGWVRITKTSEVENEKFIKALGPDMLQISLDDFQKILSKTSRNIKVLLMDQTKIGGVGNIYTNDALWKSKVNPRKPAKTLSNLEVNELYLNLGEVLHEGLKYGGASELAFVTPNGNEGEYQNHTLAYGHTGKICERCKKTKIEKFFLGGRGTYWCPKCQK